MDRKPISLLHSISTLVSHHELSKEVLFIKVIKRAQETAKCISLYPHFKFTTTNKPGKDISPVPFIVLDIFMKAFKTLNRTKIQVHTNNLTVLKNADEEVVC